MYGVNQQKSTWTSHTKTAKISERHRDAVRLQTAPTGPGDNAMRFGVSHYSKIYYNWHYSEEDLNSGYKDNC